MTAPESSHVKRPPTLIVEVLSPSTEAYDRGNKFAAYRQLESLQEYGGLVSLDFHCRVGEVFEGVEGE